ncbi:MAG: transglycosylase SLT domain-containing protein [Ancalomicrobiaceae bacterium]|nr:transglycosylase SLT domain-containing protein [Ancalomicrobiaceae bacterium]
MTRTPPLALPLSYSRSSRLAALAATLAALSASGASAEVVVNKGKSDRAIVVSALEWQPSAVSVEWLASAPAHRATPAERRIDPEVVAHTPQDPLHAAFGLFEDGTPVSLANSRGFVLRTASLDPETGLLPSAPVSAQAAPAANATLPGRSGPLPPAPGRGQQPQPIAALPLPPRKPPLPAPVRVASLTTGDLPSIQTKPSAIEAAPILGEPRKMPNGAQPYLDLFRREARTHNIPLWLALGVAWVESKFEPKLRGTHTVVGMMQVMPQTAREMGYRGTVNQLFDPETNIVWGMHELSKDYQLARGDICLTIAKYKGGFRTNHINRGAANYCSQVKRVTGMP